MCTSPPETALGQPPGGCQNPGGQLGPPRYPHDPKDNILTPPTHTAAPGFWRGIPPFTTRRCLGVAEGAERRPPRQDQHGRGSPWAPPAEPPVSAGEEPPQHGARRGRQLGRRRLGRGGGSRPTASVPTPAGPSASPLASACGLVGLKPTYGAGLPVRPHRLRLQLFLTKSAPHRPIGRRRGAGVRRDRPGRPMDSTSRGSVNVPAATALQRTSWDENRRREGISRGPARPRGGGGHRSAQGVKTSAREIVWFELPELGSPCRCITSSRLRQRPPPTWDGTTASDTATAPPHYEDVNDRICKTRSEGFGAEVKRRILLGTCAQRGQHDACYKKAQNLRGVPLWRQFHRAFAACDVPAPHRAHDGLSGKTPPCRSVETYLTDICTVPVNIAGPPCGVPLPCRGGRPGAAHRDT